MQPIGGAKLSGIPRGDNSVFSAHVWDNSRNSIAEE